MLKSALGGIETGKNILSDDKAQGLKSALGGIETLMFTLLHQKKKVVKISPWRD